MKKDSIKEEYYRLHPFKDLISVLKKLEDRSSIGKNIVITKYYKKKNYEEKSHSFIFRRTG